MDKVMELEKKNIELNKKVMDMQLEYEDKLEDKSLENKQITEENLQLETTILSLRQTIRLNEDIADQLA